MYLDLPRILYLYWIWHYLIHILIKAKKEPKMFWKISLTDIGDISTWWWKKCSRICGEMFFKLTLHTRTCQTKNTKPQKYIWWKTMVGTGHFLRFIHSWKNMTHINSKVIFFSDNPIICGKENTIHRCMRSFMRLWKIKPCLKTCLGFFGANHPAALLTKNHCQVET